LIDPTITVEKTTALVDEWVAIATAAAEPDARKHAAFLPHPRV
jgi:hypothetical protein